MDLEKATSHIDALYEKKGLSTKVYHEATELQEFGTVVEDDVSRMICVLARLTRARRIQDSFAYLKNANARRRGLVFPDTTAPHEVTA